MFCFPFLHVARTGWEQSVLPCKICMDLASAFKRNEQDKADEPCLGQKKKSCLYHSLLEEPV